MKKKKCKKRIRADSKKRGTLLYLMLTTFVSIKNCLTVAYASSPADEINSELQKIINNVINPIFVSVGVILTVYSIGQLVLAFKNEDADSKSRASSQMVVGIILIAMPSIIKSLQLMI